MSYRVGQNFKYTGNDHWDWSAWIKATDIEMGRVNSVTWILHSSFKVPTVTISNPSGGFRLNSGGWGTFRLYADVRLKRSGVYRRCWYSNIRQTTRTKRA
jgi:transcription initiation factor IIF auxiliary subunit